MAIRLPDGSIQMSDGRIIYANSIILANDLIELLPLLIPPPAWPFVSGGGGGGPGPQGPAGPAGSGGGGGGGSQGTQGFQGTNPGVQGPQGLAGAAGTQGSQGNQGFTGTGAQGFQGLGGPQGNQGLVGSGAQGNQGDEGPQGNQGPGGAAGGPQGNQGPQGPQGIAGVQGPQGFQGFQGTGVQGPQGILGTQGNQGFQGTSGAGAAAIFQNVQENTLTTTDATPTVILSETIAAATVGTFRVVVDARYDDGSLHASFVKTVKVVREGAGAILGTENSDYTDDESLALTATFTVSGNDIQVTVIGVAATSITWKARMGRVNLP